MNQQLQNINFQPNGKSSLKIIRLPLVKNLTGYSRSAIYLKVSQGVFPQPISLGARAVGWLESEIMDWIAGRVQASRNLKN